MHVTTFSGLGLLTPSPGDWINITDADPTNNPNGYPIYIQYQESPIEKTHLSGYIKLPHCSHRQEIKYDSSLNCIFYFYEQYRNCLADDGFTNGEGLLPAGNCVKAAIEMTEAAYAGVAAQWQHNKWVGAKINYTSGDVQWVTLELEPDSEITLPLYGSIYYAHLAKSAKLIVGEGASIYYVDAGMHSSITFGSNNRGALQGANQAVGSGAYYFHLGMHCVATIGNNFLFDNTYVRMKDASEFTAGTECEVSAPIVIGEKSKLTLGESATITKNLVLGSCSSLVAGDNFSLSGNLSIEDFVYVTGIGNSKSWGAGTIRRDSSTLQFTFDVGSSVTPDGVDVKWGNGKITCASSAISLTSIANLRPNCVYEYTADAGKQITFVNGYFFKMIGGSNVMIDGINKIVFKTNSDASAALMQYACIY